MKIQQTSSRHLSQTSQADTAFRKQLRSLFVTPYPFVSIVTAEESRATKLLQEEAALLNLPIAFWWPEEHHSPALSLQERLEQHREAPTRQILTIVDGHTYIHDEYMTRLLRVIAREAQDPKTTIVFVSPVPIQPPTLATDWRALRMPLPDAQQLHKLIGTWLPPALFPALETQQNQERLALAVLGLTEKEANRALARARAMWHMTHKSQRGNFDLEAAVIQEKGQLLQENSSLELLPATTGLEQIGGLHALKEWLHERRFAFSQSARQFGLPAPKGILLLGVQGCGKSTVAKAMSRFWGIPLLRFHFGGIFSQTDSPDSALQHAFHVAESMSPCIFWIDEIEKGLEHAEGVMARLLGTLLTWLQEKEKPVFFVATANQIEHLPPELLRQGRLDEVFFLDLPDQQARQDILSLHLQARGRQPKEFPIEQIAAHCEHFSGAELEQIVVSGMYKAFAQKTSLNGEQLWAAVHETKPLYALYEEQIKAFRSWAKQRTRAAAHKRELLELFTPNSNPEGFTNVMPRTTNEASCFKVEQNG